MENLQTFFLNNKKVLIAILLGCIVGIVYWYFIGCFWGTYPFSAEWWFNALNGGLLFGFFVCLLEKRI